MVSTIIWPAVLGALTTLAVAWIGPCFPKRSPEMITQNYPKFDGEQYMVAVSKYGPCMRSVFWRCQPEEKGYGKVELGDPDREPPEWSGIWSSETRRAAAASGRSADGAFGHDYASGWPLLAMVGATSPSTPAPSSRWYRDGTVLCGPDRVWPNTRQLVFAQVRRFPLVPMWSGFLADTAVYALVWLLALRALAAWVRRRRKRAGRCLHCRYDLRATPPDAPCPECGRPR